MADHLIAAGAARRPATSALARAGFRGIIVWLAAAVLVLSPPALGGAQEPAGRAATSRAARDDAIRSIPLARMSPDDRAKIASVLSNVSVFRRLPVQSVDCEPELFHYLVRNPEIIVGIWQTMGITNVAMERLDAEHFRCNDGDGTTAHAKFVFHNHDTYVLYAEGMYDGPMFPRPVRGQCVVVLKTAGLRETNGRYYVTCRLDTFVHVENSGVEMVAKMFQGWLGRTIDYNFAETVKFMGSVSRAAETNPAGMRRLAARLSRVDSERRVEFAHVTDRVAKNLSGVELVDAAAGPR